MHRGAVARYDIRRNPLHGALMVTPTNNSYAPPKSVVADVVPAESGIEKASRASRFGAALLDGLIFGIPFIPSYIQMWPTFLAASRGGAIGQTPLTPWAIYGSLVKTGFWFYVASVISLCTLVITVILVHRNAQTIGKKLCGIKVARKDGSRATLARIFWLRYVVNTLFVFIPGVGRIYALVDALFIFGEAKRCLHDYIADTIVIRA
jgi:uncharacterized RDD family membrane protein YckC